MARWNPSRWSLGASALVALAVAGCGSSAHQAKVALHRPGEQRLLTLIARAHTAAANDNRAAIDTALTQFVTDVNTLRASGELTSAAATSLQRQAQATVRAAERLHPPQARGARSTTTRTATHADQTTTTASGSPTTTPPTTVAAPPTTTVAAPSTPTPTGPATPAGQDMPTTATCPGAAPPIHGRGLGNPHGAWPPGHARDHHDPGLLARCGGWTGAGAYAYANSYANGYGGSQDGAGYWGNGDGDGDG